MVETLDHSVEHQIVPHDWEGRLLDCPGQPCVESAFLASGLLILTDILELEQRIHLPFGKMDAWRANRWFKATQQARVGGGGTGPQSPDSQVEGSGHACCCQPAGPPPYPDVGHRMCPNETAWAPWGWPGRAAGGLSCPVLLTLRAAPWGFAQGNNPPTPTAEGERGRMEEGSQSKQRQDGEPPRDRVIHSLVLSYNLTFSTDAPVIHGDAKILPLDAKSFPPRAL